MLTPLFDSVHVCDSVILSTLHFRSVTETIKVYLLTMLFNTKDNMATVVDHGDVNVANDGLVVQDGGSQENATQVNI